MMGIFSKTMNKQGAIAGMLAGIGVTMFYVFAHKGFLFIKGTEYLGLFGGKANFFFGISPNAFGAIGAIFNFAVAFAVKNMTPPVPDDIAQMVEDVRIPRGSKKVDGAH
jgi:cation/acetate symporter